MTATIGTINFLFVVVGTINGWFDWLYANVGRAESAIKFISLIAVMFAGIVSAVVLAAMFAHVAAAVLFVVSAGYLVLWSK